MKDVYVPFIRQEGIEITTIALMKFKVTDETKESDLHMRILSEKLCQKN